MRKEKKLTYGPRDIGVSWAFFFLPHAVLLLPPASLSFIPPPTLSPFPPCEQSFTAGCCGGGGVVIRRLSFVVFIFVPRVPVSCSSFVVPLSIVPRRWLLAPAIHPTSSGLQG